MLGFLKSLLSRDRTPPEDPPAPALREVVEHVLERLRQLEDLQAGREVAWAETKDQILRHLKRANALEQRARERDEADQQGPADPKVLAAVLRSKFHNGG